MYGASVSVGLQVFDAADIASIWMKIEQGCALSMLQHNGPALLYTIKTCTCIID
jgi:hypothetical protein